MRYRTLGGTGIEVSVHCLGAMMFGSVGNPEHAELIRDIRRSPNNTASWLSATRSHR